MRHGGTLHRHRSRSAGRRLYRGRRTRSQPTSARRPVHAVPGGLPRRRLPVPDHVNSGTETVTQDTNQGPYEGADDALIGVQNNSSSPVSELPLSVPNSDLFGFEGDGICDPGGLPVPSGCVPQPGAPAGTACQIREPTARSRCPPVSPPATSNQALQAPGCPQNGYEGPHELVLERLGRRVSGVVHFSPAIPPGGSTYFSLEEPPVGTSIGVGGTAPSFQRDVADRRSRHRRELLGAL